jgi:uncharacterized membrane protein YgaE (UPF0421/DUF939 family)
MTDLFAKRFLTVVLICLTELGYIAMTIAVFMDFIDTSVPYEWIITRLLLIIIGVVASPIIISHVIQWMDNYFTKERD